MTGGAIAVERADTVEALVGAGWDELDRPGSFYVSTPWLRVAEIATPSDRVYLTTNGPDGHVLAGLPCYVVDSTAPLVFTRVDRVLSMLAAKRSPSRHPGDDWLSGLLPNLLCGGRQAGYTSLPRASGADADAADRLLDAAEAAASEAGARSIAFLYVDADDSLLRESLLAADFVEFFHTHRCLLDVPWDDFDGYLAEFSSSRRVAIKRELRKVADAGVSLETVPMTEELAPRLAELELNLVRKYGGPRTAEQLEHTLRTLARCLEGRMSLSVARSDGEIYGFASLARWGNALYARHVGFDYDFQGKLPLYFSVLFYEPVRHSIQAGVARIEYGMESLEAKLSRGCRAVPLYGYVKAAERERQERLREIFGALSEVVAPDEP